MTPTGLSYTFMPSQQGPRNPGKRTKQAQTPQTATLVGKRVVVVEDEGITQMQLHMILRRAGLNPVGTAMSGEAGVKLALRERPDLILMDIKMPGAIDGLEATRRILAEYRTCIVILTAYADLEVEAMELGVSGYVIKPINGETLIPMLQKAFERFRDR